MRSILYKLSYSLLSTPHSLQGEMSSPTDQSSCKWELNHLEQFSVSEPFLTDSGADVVLVSCDNYEFRTRRSILL